MRACHWLAVLSLVAACKCASIHDFAKRATEPSLDLTLATGPSKPSTSRQHAASKAKAPVGFYPGEASTSTFQRVDKAAFDAQDASLQNWLALGQPGTSTVQETPTRRVGRPRTRNLPSQTAQEKKERYWQEWERLGLGMEHMTPAELARGVRRIQYDGYNPQLAAQWVNKKLKSDPKYHMEYDVAQRDLTHRLSQSKRRMKTTSAYFKQLPPKVQNEIVFTRLMQVEAKKGAAREAGIGPRPANGLKEQLRRAEEDAKVANVGQLFEHYFAVKEIDPARLSPKDLEEATRGLPMDDYEERRFRVLLGKYLKNRQGIDLGQFKFYRRKYNKSADVGRRREAKARQATGGSKSKAT